MNLARKGPCIDLFLRSKPAQILVSLKDKPKYATILSKETDCTYSHTVKILTVFKKFGLVNFDKKGRIKIVSLTPEGRDIANLLHSLIMKLAKLKEKS